MAEGSDYKNIGIYPGADYGFDPDFAGEFSVGMGPQYPISAGSIGVTTDARTAAQLKEVSTRLGTGAKTIEISGVSAAELESIPEHHLEEINRLRKLTGVDLTFHGPLVEPTGVSKQGWNESHREQAERQMWSAVKRAHKFNPDGNVVVTFHSSNGIPDPEERIINEETGKEEIKAYWIADETTGRFEPLTPKPDYFKSKDGKDKTPKEQIEALNDAVEKQNKDAWFRQLQHTSFNAGAGSGHIEKVLGTGLIGEGDKSNGENTLKLYKDYLDGKDIDAVAEKIGGQNKEVIQKTINELVSGDNYLRDAYQELQNLFNQAYTVAKYNNAEDDLAKMDKYRSEIKSKIDYLESPEKLSEFSDEIVKGVNVLRAIKPPQAFKPLREFAIDKASETFSNLALKSYDEFKDTAPIISVENPPAGMGLARADDLKDLIEESREKLQRKLVDKSGLSEDSAKRQAEKLMGITWDVGHINMIRKFGYDEAKVIEETEKVAPLVKHVHLSDNFGMEHTELPMGMGNVPTKPMLEAIHKYNDKVKHIIETGGAWFRDFKISPLKETFRAMGSPLYSMQMGPHWGNAAEASGGYFSGFGQMLPEQHFNLYGAGFANLPPELGGQMSGVSRASGAPIE